MPEYKPKGSGASGSGVGSKVGSSKASGGPSTVGAAAGSGGEGSGVARPAPADYGSNEVNKEQVPPTTGSEGFGVGDLVSAGLDGLWAAGTAVDAFLLGGGEEANWAHGSRLTSEFADNSQGPAIRGYADRDINVDLLLAIAKAKGMPINAPMLTSLSGKTGLELLEAIAKNAEIIEGGVETLEELFAEAAVVFDEGGDPETASKLRAHGDTCHSFNAVEASGFTTVDTTDGPEAGAAHPTEGYIDLLGWVPKTELVLEYGKVEQWGKRYEYVLYADGVKLFAVDGVKADKAPSEVTRDAQFFSGGKTVRSGKTTDGVDYWCDEPMPNPAWATRG